MTPLFVDTNVLVYLLQSESPFHTHTRSRLASLHSEGFRFVISHQVLRELAVVLTHPNLLPALSHEQVIGRLRDFQQRYLVLTETVESHNLWLALLGRHRLRGKVIHDANLVATMLAHQVTSLLTNNARDFAVFAPEGLTVLPLAA